MSIIRTVDRYVLREVLAPFLLGVGVLTFALVVARVLKLIEMVVNHGVSFLEIMKLLGLIVPGFLELILPMAVLLGALLGFGRLSGDLELTAARACGISLYRLAIPVMIFATAAWAASSWLAFTARPWAMVHLRAELFDITRTEASDGLKEKIFNKAFTGLAVYVEHIEPPGTHLKGVLISDARNPAQPSTIIAKNGLLLPDERQKFLTLRLLDGSIFGLDVHSATTHLTSFDVYDITITPGEALGVYRHFTEEMSPHELRSAIEAGRRANKRDYLAETEMARKFTVPFAAMLFAMLGITMGLKPARGGQSERFGLSVALFFGYYILMRAGQSFAESGKLNAYLAMGFPDVVFAVLAVSMFYRSATDATDQSRGPGDLLWDMVERFERRRVAA